MMEVTRAVRRTIRSLIPSGLRRLVKTTARRLKGWWISTFFSFGPSELKQLLQELGIAPGDAVIVHSSFESFRGFKGSVTDAIRVLEETIGPDGALLMPTLPFSASAIEYVRGNPVTDVGRTPSRMGLITEVFRRLPGVQRSIHPTHPVAGWGSRAACLLATHQLAETPCGAESPFGKLLEAHGKILMLGVGTNSMTFFHFLEEDLEPRLPFSPFTREVFTLPVRDQHGDTVVVTTRLYDPIIGAQRDVKLLESELKSRGRWRQRRVGRLTATVLSCSEVRQAASDLASRGLFCYRNVPQLIQHRASSELHSQIRAGVAAAS